MANVLDFKCGEYPKDLLKDIFEHQHKLAEKYIPIEKSNGLCLYDKLPADIDDSKAQARIKDMSWRAIEEVAEAMEAYYKGEMIHFYEELADALHFLVEKYLLCDFYPYKYYLYTRYFPTVGQPISELGSWFNSPKELGMDKYDNLYIAVADFTVASGLTCNCLKNKPWKQSQVLTDEQYFRLKLTEEFNTFINICSIAGFDDKSLYDMYIRKNQVNQFRQNSKY